MNKNTDVDERLSHAQTKRECLIVGCDKGGRVLARMGKNIELTYCGHHRKYGERVVNFLVSSAYNYKLKNLLKESKDDLFMNNMPELSEDSYKKLAEYTTKMIDKLDEVEEWHEKAERLKK